MGHLTADTIGGYNAFIDKQKKEAGAALVTTVLFDDYFEILHNAIDIRHINPLTSKDYFVRGSTALLDAIGKTINITIGRVRSLKEDYQASKVIFVIITDGYENASCEYSYSTIKKMIDYQSEKYHWEFLFLGANIDAAAEGEKMGIRRDRSTNYTASREGSAMMYQNVAENISFYRQSGTIKEDWDESLKEDAKAKVKPIKTGKAVKTERTDKAVKTERTGKAVKTERTDKAGPVDLSAMGGKKATNH